VTRTWSFKSEFVVLVGRCTGLDWEGGCASGFGGKVVLHPTLGAIRRDGKGTALTIRGAKGGFSE